MATAAQQQQQQFDPGSLRLDETTRSDIDSHDLADDRDGPGSSRTLRKTTPRGDREKKIGHRRVDDAGTVTYKKKPTSELMTAMQLGIGQSITSLSAKPKRDLLLQDFSIVETVFFPREGSNLTPAHHYSDFRFKTYAPIAFRYFRELFGIQPDDFLLSMCNEAMVELENPGASGSIFYISADDEFIIKTVQHKEAEFLQKLLPGYYMNLNQNPRTLLPKFYGLYCYQCGGKNIRFVVMNNLLPSLVKMHEKYDLKGSTYKRKATKNERSKKSPTYKDLDFMENHPEGIMLEADTYNALVKTIERDCRVLQSFKIMDYSLLMGIYNIDHAAREKSEELGDTGTVDDPTDPHSPDDRAGVARGRSVRQRVAQYSTAMEAIQARSDPLELNDDDIPAGGIPARNSKGERLLLFLGHIDILQSYRLKKKLEHAMKSVVIDGDSISVHKPGFYANRFQSFFRETVFKKITSSLKQSPSKKKPAYHRGTSVAATEVEGRTPDAFTLVEHRRKTISHEPDLAAAGGRPDLLPANATPPRMSIDSSHNEGYPDNKSWNTKFTYSGNLQTTTTTRTSLASGHGGMVTDGDHMTAEGGGSLAASDIRPPSSPVYSFSESTPTHTEFTEDMPYVSGRGGRHSSHSEAEGSESHPRTSTLSSGTGDRYGDGSSIHSEQQRSSHYSTTSTIVSTTTTHAQHGSLNSSGTQHSQPLASEATATHSSESGQVTTRSSHEQETDVQVTYL